MKRACILLILAGLLLTPRPALAQEAVLDPVEAIRQGKNMPAVVQELVKQGQAIVAPVASLLQAKEIIPRVIATQVLAKLAETVQSPELVRALAAACKDSSPGVRYWGIIGSLNARPAGADVADILKPALAPKENAMLRNIAIQQAAARKSADLVPELMKLLQAEAKKYESARQRILTQPLKTVEEMVRERVGNLDPNSPTVQKYRRDLEAWYRDQLAIAAQQGAVTLKPAELSARDLNTLTEKFVSEATVQSVRFLGATLEQITGQDWGFAKTPPWDYTECIDRVIGWYKQQGGTLTEEE